MSTIRTMVTAHEALADGLSASAMLSVAAAQRDAGNYDMATRARRVAEEMAALTGVNLDCRRARREALNDNTPPRKRQTASRRNYGAPRNRRVA